MESETGESLTLASGMNRGWTLGGNQGMQYCFMDDKLEKEQETSVYQWRYPWRKGMQFNLKVQVECR